MDNPIKIDLVLFFNRSILSFILNMHYIS